MAPSRRQSSGASQFRAVLRKNWLLRLRGGRKWFGLGGWFAAVVEVLVPVLFFLVMCIPKHYMHPMPVPRALAPLYPVDTAAWGELYQGPASNAPDGAAQLLYAPNTTQVTQLMLLLAKRAACPPTSVGPVAGASSFYHYFSASAKAAAAAHPGCATGGTDACQAEPACYLPLFERQLVGYATAADATRAAAENPGTVDALLDFTTWQQALDEQRGQQGQQGSLPAQQQPQQARWRLLERPGVEAETQQAGQAGQAGQGLHPSGQLSLQQGPREVESRHVYGYTLRMNHSEVPPTRMRLNQFDLLPGNQYKQYWFFSNLQNLVEQAVLAHAAAAAATNDTSPLLYNTAGPTHGGADVGPAWLAAAAATSPPLLPLALSVKAFPWPALTLDLGATAAALFFNMLLVFAFLQPTRAAIMSVVQERELLLREGMRILGLRDGAYWASWFLTHWSSMAVSGTLCALIGLYPFAHSSFGLMLAFYWLVAASLLLFAYCVSTLFSKTRVAGGAGAVLYSLAMVPGYLMPSLQPYGGPGWALSCLLPPSAISLFASVLVKHEAVQQGLSWRTLAMPVTVEGGFSAASVYRMLLLDVLLYAVLLWYLDQVMPSDVGQQLHWTFPLSADYWRQQWRGLSAARRPPAAAWESDEEEEEGSRHGGGAAVRIVGLRKVFRTTDGMDKVAVDGLSLEIPAGQITALLGHNGAGKTTTISILTGLLPATAGDAYFFPPAAGQDSCTAAAAGGQPRVGLSVRRDMAAIRGSLGVCPQFDVLWPQLTVREHLELYGAIKGYAAGAEQAALAEAAAAEVGLASKLGAAAGELSGGQKRKLSVALAFVGDPSVVILDEPTSGMDPYTRRFTWGVIQARRAKSGTAVLLTSHSMEEADLLADGIAIMSHGRLAALGTSLELKAQFGVGYTLTVSLTTPGAGDGGSEAAASAVVGAGGGLEALTALVRQYVGDAQLLAASGSEAVYRLPKESAATFPPLLRALEQERGGGGGGGHGLGLAGYGLSETTLEEVFLRVSESAAADVAAAAARAAAAAAALAAAADGGGGGGAKEGGLEAGGEGQEREQDESEVTSLPRQYYLKGWRLWLQQLRALLAKRALCAARDGWAALVQVAVPVLLVLLALWTNHISAALPQQPPLALDRLTALSGNPAAFGAAADVRGPSGGAALQAFLAGYPEAQDSGTTRVLTLPMFESLNGSLDGWLLDRWYDSSARQYDAFFLQNLPANLSGAAAAAPGGGAVQYSVMANQTAIHGLPAAVTQASRVHAALLRWLTGDNGADIRLTSHPFPALAHEQDMQINEEAGTLLLVMCVVLATSVLSASFAIFLVRERSSGSKAVQLIAGAAPSAFWAANLLFDLLYFMVPAALMVALFAAFQLPAFSGPRLAAVATLLAGFAPAGLCLTYLVQAAFQDEVRVLVRSNTLYFTSGYLGYLAVWILDTIAMYMPSRGVNRARNALLALFQSLSPHFCVARGMHKISNTYKPDQFTNQLGTALCGSASASGLHSASSMAAVDGSLGSGGWPEALGAVHPGQSPFAWEVTGQLLACMAAQAVLYASLVLLVEAGLLPRAWRRLAAAWAGGGGVSGNGGEGYRLVPGQEGAAQQQADVAVESGEGDDEDVAAERLAIQTGQLAADRLPILLRGVSKTFWQPPDSSTPDASHGPGHDSSHSQEQAAVRPANRSSGAVRAVRDLWLSIGTPRPAAGSGPAGSGECFGLLGVNGAGKTTTFRMLTGEVAPDSGDALVGGLSLLRQPAAARQLLGYCPQASALPAQMTGREVVRLYSCLRGLPERLIECEASRMLKQLGLTEYAGRACGSYSGGNRRKLSVAAALVGGAEVVLLDEPSTGMDPGARRALWGVIRHEMAGGRTVLLTSHSMEECEAVCARVGIMSGGRLRALGSVQHLKNKHGQGYSLEMRVPAGCVAAAQQLVTRCCPGARRRPEHWQAAAAAGLAADDQQGGGTGQRGGEDSGGSTHLSFMIPQHQADLPGLFDALEGSRSGGASGNASEGVTGTPDRPLVLEYSVSQTSLEQVFLALAAAAAGQPT
ncbi:ATP-binding cassette sub-family A member 3 [Chlorella vulgaris]